MINEECIRVKALLNEINDNIDNFTYGERVKFSSHGVSGLYGTIEVKDYSGGGIYWGVTPSVDIMCDDRILYKHVSIVDVQKCTELI